MAQDTETIPATVIIDNYVTLLTKAELRLVLHLLHCERRKPTLTKRSQSTALSAIEKLQLAEAVNFAK